MPTFKMKIIFIAAGFKSSYSIVLSPETRQPGIYVFNIYESSLKRCHNFY